MPSLPPDGASNGSAGTPRPSVVVRGEQQSLADTEQTLADSDQTLSGSDQTSSDSDQTSADSDQVAADRDQAASDRDLAAGADPEEHDVSRVIRLRAARQRDQTARTRLDAANKRDTLAHTRDLTARARDQAADVRDLAIAQRSDGAHALIGAEIVMHAAAQRKRAACHRAEAAEQSALAAQDRQRSAQDREQAARERQRSLADREELARALSIAETDELTGTRTRRAGLTDLDHELNRCRRTSGLLSVAYVDVIGLKAVNDTEGHSAGDDLLKRVVAHMKTHLRPYDLIVRLGGDEFLCAMSNMTLPAARERFEQVTGALAAAPQDDAIRTGFAQLAPDESATQLISRADSELLDTPHADHHRPPAVRPDDNPAGTADEH
jgi:diguanylate cyclase (GGDEF)-like protein